jgi:adenosylcobyric acid synthase
MTAKSIMFMGTGSDVGKSLIVAGLCRLLANRGIKVAPFKPQNMSNNAAVTNDGGEIGRAQALQARAARVSSTIHMNPILLKPETDTGAQIIVQGKRVATMVAKDFFACRRQFMPAILDSFEHMRSTNDVVLVEGAGSPAEINLRDGDLANMGFASAAKIPAVLVGDIHRGGVMASISGTFDLLPAEDRIRLKAFIINKFHGDQSLFADGRTFLESRTGTLCLGIIPHFNNASRLPAEDAVILDKMTINNSNKIKICVLRLPRIANFDDLDPLRLEPNVNLQFLQPGDAVPGDARLVIIPGSKSTIADLETLFDCGWNIDLQAHLRRGGHVLGLCGGYQMLGKNIHDPEGLEGRKGSVPALGFLDVETQLMPEKTLNQVVATHYYLQKSMTAYQIHLGKTSGESCDHPFAVMTTGKNDGATSMNRRVQGTYLHGCFASDGFRSAYLKSLGIGAGDIAYEQTVDATLDQLATHLRQNIDVERLLELAV